MGFFRARIGRELEFNEKQNWVTVTFVIDEGPRFKVRNVSVIGNTKYTSEALMAELKLKSGDYFNQAKMTADKNSLVDKYGGIGYVFADIKPGPRFLEEAAQLDLVYNISEGDRYRVGKINVVIKGDYPHTQLTTVLNRLSLKPGDIVDIREIRASERRLKASQLFEVTPATATRPKIVFNPPGQEKQDDDEDEVAEKPKTKSGRGGGRRGMGRGFGGGSPARATTATAPRRSAAKAPIRPPASGCSTLRWTAAATSGDAEISGRGSGQRSAAADQRPGGRQRSDAGPSQWARGQGAGAENDSLAQRGRTLSEALAQGRIDRSRTILTQYSPNSGQVNPASQPSAQWTSNPPPSDQTYAAGPPQAARAGLRPGQSEPAGGLAAANAGGAGPTGTGLWAADVAEPGVRSGRSIRRRGHTCPARSSVKIRRSAAARPTAATQPACSPSASPPKRR